MSIYSQKMVGLALIRAVASMEVIATDLLSIYPIVYKENADL